MIEEFKEELVKAVQMSVDLDVLTDEEALAIITICKDAMARKEIDATEKYLMGRIEGGEAE